MRCFDEICFNELCLMNVFSERFNELSFEIYLMRYVLMRYCNEMFSEYV